MKKADRVFSFWTPERLEAEHCDTNCRYIVTEWTNHSSLSVLVCVCVCVVEGQLKVVGTDFNK